MMLCLLPHFPRRGQMVLQSLKMSLPRSASLCSAGGRWSRLKYSDLDLILRNFYFQRSKVSQCDLSVVSDHWRNNTKMPIFKMEFFNQMSSNSFTSQVRGMWRSCALEDTSKPAVSGALRPGANLSSAHACYLVLRNVLKNKTSTTILEPVSWTPNKDTAWEKCWNFSLYSVCQVIFLLICIFTFCLLMSATHSLIFAPPTHSHAVWM